MAPKARSPHGGTYETDYSDLAVTKCACEEDAATAQKECKARIALRAAGIQTSGNLTALGEGVLGGSASGAGAQMVAAGGAMVTGGWTLIAAGVVIAGKEAYDFYVTTQVGEAALAAASRYCDCATAAT
jgi:hypothetical protein